MLSDTYIKSLKIGDKKRHTDRNGLVLELRPSKKKLNKVFIEFAVGASITSNYPFIGLHKALVPKPKVVNQPAISSHEAHDMLAIISNSNATKIMKIYIELLAHLFTRPSELRLAQWSEFNFHEAKWHIPVERMKMAVAHWVPLSPQVLKLLKELRLITGFTPYLFVEKKRALLDTTHQDKILLSNVGLFFP